MSIPREELVNPQFIDTAYAKAQETIGKHLFVTDAGTVAGAGEGGFPVQFDYVAGDDVALIRSGTAKVIAGAAVAANADVESDADGKAITLNTGKKNGRTINSAAQAGDILYITIP